MLPALERVNHQGVWRSFLCKDVIVIIIGLFSIIH